MTSAIDEARRGLGRTAPNPPVGCVVVRDDVLLGSGWHRRAGCPHAEREALAAGREAHGAAALRGATVYVTLEPCSTTGRTPPCTDALIEAGVGRVVFACHDPDPANRGGATAALQAVGIAVESRVMEAEATRLIRPFTKRVRTGLPWVIWKSAMSLDGRLTRPDGEGMWLTGEPARARVQSLRSEVDAIITSGETVRRDRPRLDLRNPAYLEGREQPWRVVLTDRPRSLPIEAPLFTDAHRSRTLVRPRGEIGEVLEELVTGCGVNTVLLECGGRLAADFAAGGWIDEAVLFLAPLLCGGPISALGGPGLPDDAGLSEVRFEAVGEDVMLRGIWSGGR